MVRAKAVLFQDLHRLDFRGNYGIRRRSLQGMCSRLAGMQDFSVGDAQHQRCRYCEEQGCGDSYAYLRRGQTCVACLFRWTLRRRKGKSQIVGCGQAGVEQTDDGQPDRTSSNCRRKA